MVSVGGGGGVHSSRWSEVLRLMILFSLVRLFLSSQRILYSAMLEVHEGGEKKADCCGMNIQVDVDVGLNVRCFAAEVVGSWVGGDGRDEESSGVEE